MVSSRPTATIVLATYNAASTLAACLDSLTNQSVTVEIIVVDDGSLDETQKILKRYPKVKVLHQKHAGPAIARNRGVAGAKADVVVFADADMRFDRDYVKHLIAPIQRQGVIGTYTREERVDNWDNVWARCWNYQEGWEDRKRFPKLETGGTFLGTDFRAIQKKEFQRVGGFDSVGYTDTWSLFRKLGVRPLPTKAVCYHRNPATLSAVYRQAKWSAKRPYKFGTIGVVYALLRTSPPVSIISAVSKAVAKKSAPFFVFKLIYDWARFVGITHMLVTGSKIK